MAKYDDRWPPAQAIGHPFYGMLERLLAEAGFDALVANLDPEAHFPPGIRPSVYFRMLLVGYFEGIDSQRGIAWRCGDSRSLCEFLGIPPEEAAPDHASLAETARRLPAEMSERVFAFVLKLVEEKKLFQAQTLLDSEANYLEANAAMKSIQRQDALGDFQPFLLRLAQEAAIENPREENAHVFVRNKVDIPAPSASSVAAGLVLLADKSEHVVDLEMAGAAPGRDVRTDRPAILIPDIAKPGAAEEWGDFIKKWFREIDLGDFLKIVAGSLLAVLGTLIILFSNLLEGLSYSQFGIVLVLDLLAGCFLILAGINRWRFND